jgi:hypothetical protein
MMLSCVRGLILVACVMALACSATTNNPRNQVGSAGASGLGGLAGATGSAGSGGNAGSIGLGNAGTTGGTSGVSGGSGGMGGAAGTDAGSGGISSSGGTGGSGGMSGAGGTGAGANNVTGTLGTAPLMPIMSALVAANGGAGETIIYLFSAPITCSQISSAGWLPSIASGTQVVELVMPSTTTTGTVAVPGGEVNYNFGGMLSFTETSATSGSIMITMNNPMGVIEGTVMATYSSGSISGSFHAEYCANGQGY